MLDQIAFISHAQADKAFVRKLDASLTASGISTFLDERDIKAGDSIPTKIYEAIETATHVIYVISEYSKNSLWVKEELSIAKMREKAQCGLKIIPILIENVALPTAVSHIKYANFIDWTEPKNYYNGLHEVFSSIGVEMVTPTDSDVQFYCTNFTFLNTLQSKLTEYCGYVDAANLSHYIDPTCPSWLFWKAFSEIKDDDARPDRFVEEFIALCEKSGINDGSTKAGCASAIAKNLLRLLPQSKHCPANTEIYRVLKNFVSALDEIWLELIGIFLARLSSPSVNISTMRTTFIAGQCISLDQRVKALRSSRNMIEAIRLTRKATGLNLQQAKEFVEAVWNCD